MFISPNNEYPRFVGDIAIATPGWSKGDPIPEGWTKVEPTEAPIPGQDQKVYEVFPEEIDGVFYQKWAIRELTAEEIERRDAPKTAKAKLIALGLTEIEIEALALGLI